MIKLFVKRIRSFFSPYAWSTRTRPAANRAIGQLSRMAETRTQGDILCEALWDNPHHWVRLAMVRNAIVDQYGSGLVGLYEERTRKESIESLKAFPLTAEECIVEEISPEYFEKSEKMLHGISKPRDLYEMQFPKEYPGCYFYDGVLKEHMVGQVDIRNPNLVENLARTLKYLDDYQSIVDRHNLKAAIVSHPTHFRFSTLVWTLILNEVPVYLTNYYNGHINIRVMTKPEHMLKVFDDSPLRNDINGLPKKRRKELYEYGVSYLTKLRLGKESEVARAKVYGTGKLNYKTKELFCEELQADSEKPIAIVMGNCWPDFPNGYGPSNFTDYVDWLLFTLENIKTIHSCNWILKPHPGEKFYGDKTTMKKVIGEELSEGIFWWPGKGTGREIMEYADAIVTARGTSAVEYSAIGKKVIVAYPSPFSRLGFVNYGSTKDEYANLLENITILPEIENKQIEDANIFAAMFLADLEMENFARFPYGSLSYRLYPSIPRFIDRNKIKIIEEINCIKNWSRNGHSRYNTYKILHENYQ